MIKSISRLLLIIACMLLPVTIFTSCYSTSHLNNDPAIKGVWAMQNHASVKYISLVDDGVLLLQKNNDSLYTGQYKTNSGHLLIREQAGTQDWLEFRYAVQHDSLLLDNGLKRFVLRRKVQ